jgi:hypothetical protein
MLPITYIHAKTASKYNHSNVYSSELGKVIFENEKTQRSLLETPTFNNHIFSTKHLSSKDCTKIQFSHLDACSSRHNTEIFPGKMKIC